MLKETKDGLTWMGIRLKDLKNHPRELSEYRAYLDNKYTDTNAKEQNMTNYKMRNAAIILDETLTTVKCSFNREETTYTFLCEKILASSLAQNDCVVVEKTDGTLAVVWVTSVDEESDIQLEDDYKYCFIIQRVETEYVQALNDKLRASEEELKRQQRAKLRAEVRNQLILEHRTTSDVVQD